MKPILPGAAIGVLGSGQLGRMFAIAARRMGYRVHTFSPDSDTPAGQVSDVEVTAPYEDLDAVRAFASKVRVITFEFENVPAETAAVAAEFAPVRPAYSVLQTTQNRLREKQFLERTGIPVAKFRSVASLEELSAAIEAIGCPCILKTAAFGYDGKGQFRIDSPDQAEQAWQAAGTREALLEAFVPFQKEVSVVAARSLDGAFAHYNVFENQHRRHILDLSLSPARITDSVARRAAEIARAIVEALDVVGVLCVEMFLDANGELLVNELAPRPHNSGHLTFDACLTSQFEQQLRAVCGLALGSTKQFCPAAMANLLGDLWSCGEPDWARAAALPNVKLHLYGKLEARPGRKMGHVTAMAPCIEQAEEDALAARARLAPQPGAV